MKLEISKNPETIGKVVAQNLVDEISRFQPTPEHDRMIIGLSWGRTIERIINNFVEICRQRQNDGNPIDMSKVLFLQTESFWPENPDSKSNMFANQLKAGFETPLRAINPNIEVYYPGAEPTAEEAKANFTKLSQQMDLDLATIHESGAVKGLRDADQVRDEVEWAAGRLSVRDIQWRNISDIKAGENVTINPKPGFERAPKDNPQDIAVSKYTDMVKKAIVDGDDEALVPQFFLSEGYKGYIATAKRNVINGRKISVRSQL